MPAKKYRVELSADEREELHTLVNRGKAAAYKRKHAEILLKADQDTDGPCWPDKRIAEAFDVGLRTVERVRQRLVEQGLQAAIERAKQKNRKVRQRLVEQGLQAAIERTKQKNRKAPKLDGEQEARLVALACQEQPPEGYSRWTLRLLAERMVALDYVDKLSYETVRRVLKKHHQTLAA